jgi:hypothetical protein
MVIMQDGEVRKAFERSLKKQGFNFKLNTKVRIYAISVQPFEETIDHVVLDKCTCIRA